MKPTRLLRPTLVAAAALAALSPPASAASYGWDVGYFSTSGVPASLTAADTLAIGYGNYKYVDSGMANAGTVNWVDTLYFQNGSTFSNSGLWNAIADSAFGDGGYGGYFVNSGTFRKSGGSGSTTIGNGVNFTSSGTVDAQTGNIDFAGGVATFNAGTQFTGSGGVRVSNNAAFNGAFTSQNLQLLSGTYTGSGAQINGAVDWTTGMLAGGWAVASGATLNLLSGNYHYLNGSLDNLGSIKVVDSLYLQNGNTLTNQGLYELQSDVGLYDGGYSGNFVNQGTLRKSGGAGTSQVLGVTFVNAANGVVDVQTGIIDFASGAATFNAGTQFSGAGQARISANAAFNGAFTSANLQLAAGTFTGTAAQINGSVVWTTGALAGAWDVAAGQTLTLAVGNYKNINGSVGNAGTMTVLDTLYFQNGNTLTNQGLYDMQGDVGLGDNGYSGTFVNNGIFRKSAGGGSSIVNAITFTNNGEINAQTGTIQFNGLNLAFLAGTAFSGAGQVVVANNATFVGAYTTAGNLTLASGSFTGGDGSPGSKAVMNGNTNWVTGALAGNWEVAAGRTLTLQVGNYKSINGSVGNLGTMAALDTLYFQNGNTLTNNALYDMQGDVGLGDSGYSGTFVNNGIFRKSAGAGSSGVNGITFVNNGEINAQTGNINFVGGNLRFNDGTRFSGAAQVLVSNNATFVGAYTTAGNLTLANGTYTGGDGSPGSKAVMNGNTNWVTGALAGTWEVANGRTLTLTAGNYKYVNGSLTNHGNVVAQDTLYLQDGNVVTNHGQWDLQGDVGIGDGGYNGSFVNQGLLVKSAGGGTSTLANINFSNAAGGVVDVRSGSISLPTNFNNQGTLKGSGAYSALGTLHNDGHVAPGSMGAAPTQLTLNADFAQSALGSFDVGLQDLSNFGSLRVNGAASLAGNIEVDCVRSCSFAVGTELVVLHSTGALNGSFGSLTTSGFAAGAFEVAYLGNDVLLRVTRATVAAAVPEPATYAMWLAGLGAMGFIMRRRRVA